MTLRLVNDPCQRYVQFMVGQANRREKRVYVSHIKLGKVRRGIDVVSGCEVGMQCSSRAASFNVGVFKWVLPAGRWSLWVR